MTSAYYNGFINQCTAFGFTKEASSTMLKVAFKALFDNIQRLKAAKGVMTSLKANTPGKFRSFFSSTARAARTEGLAAMEQQQRLIDSLSNTGERLSTLRSPQASALLAARRGIANLGLAPAKLTKMTPEQINSFRQSLAPELQKTFDKNVATYNRYRNVVRASRWSRRGAGAAANEAATAGVNGAGAAANEAATAGVNGAGATTWYNNPNNFLIQHPYAALGMAGMGGVMGGYMVGNRR